MQFKKLVELAPLLSATAAICSAVAAIFSAIAASTISSNNNLAARSAIYPSEWTLEQRGDHADIRFKSLENRGQGPATLVIASLEAEYPKDPEKPPGLLFGALNPNRVERIGPGERVNVDFFGTFPWTLEKKCKSVYLRVGIRSTDMYGNRWLTTYGLLAFRTPRTNCVAAMEEVAPNLHYLGILDDGPFVPEVRSWVWWLAASVAATLVFGAGYYSMRRRKRLSSPGVLDDG